MRYLLHHDILQQYLNNEGDTKSVIDDLLLGNLVYVTAESVAAFSNQYGAELQALLRQCRIARTPSYIPSEALLNAPKDTIARYAAEAMDAQVLQSTQDIKPSNTLPVPFINLKQQYHLMQAEMEYAIDSVLNSSQFIMGKAIGELEQTLSTFCGAQHAIACGSGTDAIMLALLAIDIQPGDEVIIPCFSFIATAEIPVLLKATLKFVDIDPKTYNLDVNQLEAAITEKTKAIMPVSLYGQAADMATINQLATLYSQRYGHKIYVIEDAAQSFGATYTGQRSCHLSDIAATSFFPAKPLGAYGDAGAVFTDDTALAQKMRSLLFHGETSRYHHEYVGFNGRCDTLQAAMLNVKLKYFPEELKVRQVIADRYSQELKGLDITLPFIADNHTSAWAQYSVQVKNRQALQSHLQKHQIPTAVHYPTPLHLQPCFASDGYHVGDFPVAEKVAQHILSLPMSPYLNNKEQTAVIEAIKAFYKDSLLKS